MLSFESDLKDSDKASRPGDYRLRITLIGGHTRNVRHLIDRGRMAGLKVEKHSGVVTGRGIKELRSQIHAQVGRLRPVAFECKHSGCCFV